MPPRCDVFGCIAKKKKVFRSLSAFFARRLSCAFMRSVCLRLSTLSSFARHG